MSDVERILHRLLHIEDKLDRVLENIALLGELIVALADDLKAAIAQLDAETTAIGALITALAGRIKNGMTDAEVNELKAAFQALDDRLKSLGVDPTVPVPQPTPPLMAAKKLAGHP